MSENFKHYIKKNMTWANTFFILNHFLLTSSKGDRQDSKGFKKNQNKIWGPSAGAE